MSARYIVADVFDGLATIEDDSIDLVVTSPPYPGRVMPPHRVTRPGAGQPARRLTVPKPNAPQCTCEATGIDTCPTCRPFEDTRPREQSDLTSVGNVLTRCEHEPERVRTLTSAGKSLVWERCSTCAERLTGRFLPHSGEMVDSLPIVEDRTREVPPCRRCGSRGTELHHWAPRSLFPDADIWPQDWLCPECHSEWHQVTGVALGAD